MKTIEYAVSPIDEHGDIIDTFHFKTEKLAREGMKAARIDAPALIMERVTDYWKKGDPENLEQRDHETLHTEGNEAALREGGWVK